MKNKDITLLIVDDSPVDLQICMQALKGDFKLLAATNGSMAVNMEADTSPDLILMDANMPDMDGYEACQKIIEQNENALVIFISANTSTQEILKGYEVGGTDYITKPFSPELLINKINNVIETQKEKEALTEEAKIASETVMSVLVASGDLGTVLNFIRQSFTLVDYDMLGVLIINLLRGYDLNACVMLKQQEKTYYFCDNGEVSPLEKELLSRFSKQDDRFCEHGKRLFIHYDRVTILVKNMPITDLDLTGRLKDSFAIATEAANERAAIIETQEETAIERNTALKEIDSTAHQTLDMVKNLQNENEQILDELQTDMEEAFIDLNLSDEQEQIMLKLLQVAHAKSSKAFEKSVVLETKMNKVFSMIAKM